MSKPVKGGRPRKPIQISAPTPLSHAEHMEVLQAREQGKTEMYKQDAWGHIETRFVRTQNVKTWEEKGFITR